MSVFADAWTGGFIWGTIAAIVIAVALLVGMLLLVRNAIDSYEGFDGFSLFFAGCAAVCLVATAGVWLWASWPLAYDYHHWVDKRVTVAAISSRILSDGDNGISQKFVVRDRKTDQVYGIQDTRAALLKPGNAVRLRCKRAYQYGIPRSADGWDCRWNESNGS